MEMAFISLNERYPVNYVSLKKLKNYQLFYVLTDKNTYSLF